MTKAIQIDVVKLKEDVISFSNAYFHVYHEISKQLLEKDVEQIGNFFTSSLYVLKQIIESAKVSSLKINLALNKVKRLVNEIVLLQYKIAITRILLLSFLDTSSKIIELLEQKNICN